MNRLEKQQVVSDLTEAFGAASSVVVAHYQGLTVEEITALRKKMREAGACFQVTKNTLAKLALAETQYSDIASLFSGPVAVGYSEDPVAAAKGMVDFANENEKLVILGGALNSQTMDVNGVKALADMPSLDELRAKLISLLNTPATRIAGVVQAPAGQLARVVNAYATKS